MRAADHVMLPSRHRPRPEDLIFDMHWGFPPEPRVEGVRGGDMRPPAPPPEGWEETVRRTRYLRGRVHGTLTAWGRRREGLVMNGWVTFVDEKKYYKEKLAEMTAGLAWWYRMQKRAAFDAWAELAKQIMLMRKSARKVAMWLMKKDLIRAWGAWLAIWAHYKDWRTCALKGIIRSRVRRVSRMEMTVAMSSKRGQALMHDLAASTFREFPEKIVVASMDIEALAEFSADDYMAMKVFNKDDWDKAEQLQKKCDLMMQENFARLDTLELFNGAMLAEARAPARPAPDPSTCVPCARAVLHAGPLTRLRYCRCKFFRMARTRLK